MNSIFGDIEILVIGDLMLDCYEYGQSIRMSEEAPVPIVHINKKRRKLGAGGAANVAMNVSALGAGCSLIGRIGVDTNGDELSNIIHSSEISFISIRDFETPTITKTRIISQNQQMIRLDEEIIEPISDIALNDIKEHLVKRINISDIIIISDYAKGFCTKDLCSFVIKEAAKQNKKVLVDPKGSDWFKYNGAYLIAPNLKELSQIAGCEVSNDNEEIIRLGSKAYKEINMDYLLVTRSEKGVTLINNDIEHHLPSKAQEVYDVSGAGDTLIAVLAVCLAQGKEIKNAIDIAVEACAVVVAKEGTVPVYYEDMISKGII